MGARHHTSRGLTAASRVVLDSWPIVEAAKGSKNAISAIGSLLSEQVPIMSAINYAEAYSAVFVRQGVWEARDTVELLRQVVELDIPDFERIMQAAHLKSAYYLALGDSFAAATALHHEAELWTEVEGSHAVSLLKWERTAARRAE